MLSRVRVAMRRPTIVPERDVRPWHLTLVFAAYLATAKFGLLFASAGPSATVIWVPTGIAIAAVTLLGWRVLPAVWAAAFAANVTTASTPLLVACAIAFGNCGEAWVGASILRYFRIRKPPMFVVMAVIACSISATVGLLSLSANAPVADPFKVWRVWWLGDMLGALLVAPAIILYGISREGRGRTTMLSLSVAVVVMAVAASLVGSTATVALAALAGVAVLAMLVLTASERRGLG